MHLAETVRSAWRSLVSNRLRTALTALGMIIGVAAVVAVLAVGEGARSSVETRIRALGSNLLTIRPESGRQGAVRSGNVTTLTRKDAEALGQLPGIAAVAPEAGSSGQIRYRTENHSSSVNGVTAEYLTVRSLNVSSGLAFGTLDDQQRARVTILGVNIARKLFGNAPPLGERIQINGIAFRVVGILEEKGDTGFSSPDDLVLIPLSTLQSRRRSRICSGCGTACERTRRTTSRCARRPRCSRRWAPSPVPSPRSWEAWPWCRSWSAASAS
jgi:putative ABC transport system permease protein